jgi:transposase
MRESYNRYDISDQMWALIEPHIIGNAGTWGGNAKDTRKFINAVFWILRTGAPWRDLPSSYGNWSNVNRRFCRWRDKGIWEKIFLAVIGEDECEWLIIDASFVKAHKDAHGAVGGSQDIGRSKGGRLPKSILPWMRLVVQSELLSQRVQSMIVQKLMS